MVKMLPWRVREFAFGRDGDPYYDPRVHAHYRMRDRTTWERFCYRILLPPMWAVSNWKDGWDYRFRMRYRDRWIK